MTAHADPMGPQGTFQFISTTSPETFTRVEEVSPSGSPLLGRASLKNFPASVQKRRQSAPPAPMFSASKKEVKHELQKRIDEKYSMCTHKMHGHTVRPGQECGVCRKVIWGIHKQGMLCSLCGLITHIKCFPTVMASNTSISSQGSALSSSSSNSLDLAAQYRQQQEQQQQQQQQQQDVEGSCPAHRVQHTRLLAPTSCTHCSQLIWGLLQSGVTCMVCRAVYHDRCARELNLTRVSVSRMRKEADAAHNSEPGKEEAVAVLKTLLADFGGRWPVRRKLSLANPVAHVRIFWRHSKQLQRLPTRLQLHTDDDEAREVCHAMLYAKAVYGVAYSNGHLKSVGAAVRMHTIWKPFKNIGKDVTSRDNDVGALQAVDAVHNTDRELLLSEWSNEVYRPAFALFVDHSVGWLILTIRGTVSDKDTLTDLAAEASPFLNGLGHSGVVKCTESILSHTGLNDAIQASLERWPEYRVIATGHSLGAAVATLFAVACRACDEPDVPAWKLKVEAFAYGSPPTVDNTIFTEVNRHDFVTNVVCGADAVCRVSPANLERLAREVAGYKDSELHVGMPYTRLLMPGKLLFIDNPHGRHGKRAPIKVYHLPRASSEDDIVAATENTAIPDPETLSPQQAGFWLVSQLYVTRHIFSDHLPDRYHRSLQHWVSLTLSQKIE